MWRAISNVLSFEVNNLLVDCAAKGSPHLQAVRWRRKPRWYPVAKSKMFRVPERKPQDLAEKAELQRLYNNYRLQMRSVRLFLREEHQRLIKMSTSEHYVLAKDDEEAEFQRCMEINDKWNEEAALLRNERLEREKLDMIRQAEETIEEAMEKERIRISKIDERVSQQKKQYPEFITPDNIDEVIAEALANPVDYNFAIDLNNDIHKGRGNTSASSALTSAV